MGLEPIRHVLGDGTAENDQERSQTYLRTQDYESAEANFRTLILGGRGTGKSAICKMLDDSAQTGGSESGSSNVWSVSLTFDNVTRVKLEKEAKAVRYDVPAISRQWELALLLQCFELAMERLPASVKKRRLIRDLDSEVVKLLNREDMRFGEEGRLGAIVGAAVKILRQLPFKFKFTLATPLPVSIELREGPESKENPVESDPEMDKARLIQGMYEVLKNIIPGDVKIRILIDELDVEWKARQEQIASLCGLLSAVMRMRGKLGKLGLEKKITSTIFLRADIYEILKQQGLDDASKYRMHELHLSWTPTTLRSVLDRRIEAAGVAGVETMHDLFTNEKISRRSLDDHLLTWITPRPRDLIYIVQLCLQHSGKKPLITKADAQLAMDEYSELRKTVILEETRYGLAKSGDLLDSFKNRGSEYTPKELRSHLDQAKHDNAIQLPKPKLIELLVNAGFLGVMNKEKGTSRFSWDEPAHQSLGPSENKDNEESETWIIHPALWKAFNITQSPT